MRRNDFSDNALKDWILIVDAPLNGDATDYSEYAHVPSTNGITWVDDPTDSTRKVFKGGSNVYAAYPVGLNTDNLYNNSLVQIDFYLIGNSNSYPNIIDSGQCGGRGFFTQLEGSTWYFSHTRSYISTMTWDYTMSIPKSTLVLNRWYRLEMQYYDNISTITVTDLSDDTVVKTQNFTIPSGQTSTYANIRLGSGYGYTYRYINGYLRNFKMYRHK